MSERKIEEYSQFFEEVKKFQAEQQKQKMRGLNDYNMVNVVRKENAEVGMHSNVIYSLIDPNGLHYQDNLFLKLFIQEVLTDIKDDFGEIISVDAEESTYDSRRIDFTIKSTKYYIGIEMKIDAKDLQDQLSHYENDLKEKANQDNQQMVKIYYLTKDAKEAASYSKNDITYIKVSFAEHILNWINKCQAEVRNITNLNEAFENYKNIVKKITNQYKGNVMLLEEELLKDEQRFLLAKEVSNAYQNALKVKIANIVSEQFEKVISLLNLNKIRYKTFEARDGMDIDESPFYIRVIVKEDHYFIQVTDQNTTKKPVEKIKKNTVLPKLIKLNKNFASSWTNVYGAAKIDFDKFDDFKSLLLELINFKG